MSQPPRDPLSELHRLTDHLAHLARNSTEMSDMLKRQESLVRAALLVWIAFPILLLLMVLIFLARLLSQ